ncbi:MAG: hypothetical protein BWZ10_02804 [candidate division BRC1 bacterium ADurb.BinA364]|nr:MAG: hypothetical protein BWZ10_02804 [candidate division BRC1 bacterium ADurb.BinA364]
MRGVSALKAPNLRFSWRDLGEIGRDSLPELALRVRDVPPGRFSPVERHGDTAGAYYVSEEKPLASDLRGAAAAMLEAYHADEQKRATLDHLRTAVIQSLNIQFFF